MFKKLIHPTILIVAIFFSYEVTGLSDQTTLFTAAFLISLFVVIIVMESRFFYEKRSIPTLYEIKEYLLFFCMAIGVSAIVRAINEGIYSGEPPLAVNFPLPIEIITALVLSEFGFYWYHRIAHSSPFLWKIHGLHHQIKKVNVGTYFYLHPLDAAFFYIAVSLPIIFIGFSAEAVYMVFIIQQTQKLLMHSNTGAPVRFLNYFLITAELHRMHHSKVLKEAGNFGGVLSIWDLLFGSYKTRKDFVPVEYGVYDQEKWPTTIRGLILHPFVKKR